MNSRKQYYFLAILLITTIISSCAGPSSSAPDQNLPGDPHLVVETFTPTPDPLIAGTLTIQRDISIRGGAGGYIDVTGEVPLQLLYRESAFTGDDLIETQAETTGITVMYGEGPVGSGDVTGIWVVTQKVRGVLHPAPKCDIELFIEEEWGETIDVTMTVNGQEIISTVAFTDVLTAVSPEYLTGHVTIPKGQRELVEVVMSPALDWINTYTIELTPQTKFEGCFD